MTSSMRFIEHQGMVPKHLHGCYKYHGGFADWRHLKVQNWATISKPTFVLGALTDSWIDEVMHTLSSQK